MAKSRLRLVNILSTMDNIENVLITLMKFPCLEPVPSEKIIESVHGSKPHESIDRASPLLEEIESIESGCHTMFKTLAIEGINDSLNEISVEIKDVHQQIDEFNEYSSMLKELHDKYNNAYQQISYLSSLEISLDDIFKCDYIVSRVGKLPIDSVEKLKYYTNTPFIFTSFAIENNTSWCMYFTTNGFERAVDNIFSSLLFERIYIPDFVHGTPEEAKKTLSLEIEETDKQLTSTKKQLEDYLDKHREIVARMKSELELLRKVHLAEKYIVVLGNKFSITGFVDEKDSEKLQSLFKDKDTSVEILPADFDKRLKPPKKISRKLCS